MADHVADLSVGTDGEFTHAIAVLVGMGIGPEVLLQLFVLTECFAQPIRPHANRERLVAQIAELLTEVIANDPVDNEGSVHLARCGEHFAAGQISPLVAADKPAGLEPLVIWIQIGDQVGAGCRLGRNAFSFLH